MKVFEVLTELLWDAVGLAGVSLAAYGIWEIHRPSALIFVGLILGGLYWLHETRSKPRRKRP